MGFGWFSIMAQREMVSVCLSAGIPLEHIIDINHPMPLEANEVVTAATDNVIFVHTSEKAARDWLDHFARVLVFACDVSVVDTVAALGCSLDGSMDFAELDIGKLFSVFSVLWDPVLRVRGRLTLLPLCSGLLSGLYSYPAGISLCSSMCVCVCSLSLPPASVVSAFLVTLLTSCLSLLACFLFLRSALTALLGLSSLLRMPLLSMASGLPYVTALLLRFRLHFSLASPVGILSLWKVLTLTASSASSRVLLRLVHLTCGFFSTVLSARAQHSAHSGTLEACAALLGSR